MLRYFYLTIADRFSESIKAYEYIYSEYIYPVYLVRYKGILSKLGFQEVSHACDRCSTSSKQY